MTHSSMLQRIAREVVSAAAYSARISMPPRRKVAGGTPASRSGRCRNRGRSRRRAGVAQVAGDVLAGQDLLHLRLLLGAAREGVGAAGMKPAARGRVDRARHVALKDDPLLRRIRI